MSEVKHELQVSEAKRLKPLIDAVAMGMRLEFRHNDGVWRVDKSVNVRELVFCPHRFRVMQTYD